MGKAWQLERKGCWLYLFSLYSGLLTKQDEVVLVGARRSLSAEGSVMDRGPEDGKCGCVCRGGVSEEEAVKTAQLVATCTAAATAAVLKATVGTCDVMCVL